MSTEIAERREMWAQELESGRFTQGRGRLERRPADAPVENCCLGVACRLAQEAGVLFGEKFEEDTYQHCEVVVVTEGDYKSRMFPPRIVRDFFGISVEEQNMLVEMNDGTGAYRRTNFAAIAAAIRAYTPE